MSIGIAIAVPDGIAFAADTQTTWNQTIFKAKDKATGNDFELANPIQIPVGWSRMARKLFSINMAGKVFTIITAGNASLNLKSMYAVYKSCSQKYSGSSDYDEVKEFIIDEIKEELAKSFNCTLNELKKQKINICELILATYEDNDVAKPILESHMVFSGELNINGDLNDSGYILKFTNRNNKNRYGGCWIGRAEFITHIVNHKNNNLPPISGQFHMMTLADGVDYTKFLVEFTCDFERFAIMVPDCARPIISATLTPDGYKEEII